MSLGIIAGLMMAQAPSAAVDVAFTDLVRGRNDVAIARIEANDSLDGDNPARLINLGIAHAREGRTDEARALFRSAVHSKARVRLETATGEWIDSRSLARLALDMLDRGEFASTTRVAAR